MTLEELRIYQIAVKLRKEVYADMRKIQNNWAIDDVKQIKRSAGSVAANIAEGFGRRGYPKEYIHFLSISKASSDETRNHAEALFDDTYLSKERMDYYKKNYKDLAIKTNNLIVKIKKDNNLPLSTIGRQSVSNRNQVPFSVTPTFV